MTLPEVLHYTHVKKQTGIVLKLDFEKAYDKVDWNFLIECHNMRGFDGKWVVWVKQVLFNDTVSVKLNNEIGPYFQSAKGVRQGHPFSPFLFNLAVDCLTRMVLRAQENGLITRIAADLIPNGIAILQYADDIVLCISHDIEKAINLKLLLYLFEFMSRLKINLLESEVLCEGDDDSIN